MTTTTTFLLFLLFTPSIFGRRRLACYHPAERTDTAPDESESKNPERPPTGTMAGVPLSILQSERFNSGALLRDILEHRPSERDP
jgi:hypothetical protein